MGVWVEPGLSRRWQSAQTACVPVVGAPISQRMPSRTLPHYPGSAPTLWAPSPAQDFDRAVSTLEALPPGPEADSQWRALGALALQHEELGVAERCAAALGEVARVRFLHKVGLHRGERRGILRGFSC